MTNLKFRSLQESDLETLRRWRMLPHVTKYLFTDPVISPNDQKQWFKRLQHKRTSLYWILSFHDLDIGYTALTDIDLKNKTAHPRVYICEIGYRGRGYAKHTLARLQKLAFTNFPLRKLYAQILSENYPALFTYLKNGWRIEGVLRDHIFKHKFHDLYQLALLKHDWLKWT